MPEERSVNLDTETDFLVAEEYLKRRRERGAGGADPGA